MELEEGARRKLSIVAGVLLLLFALPFFFGEEELQVAHERTEPARTSAKAEWHEVRGAKAATETKELRDPFRADHPKKEERVSAPSAADLQNVGEQNEAAVSESDGRNITPAGNAKEKVREKTEIKKAILRGTLLSKQGNLALVEIGDTVHSLAVGEGADGVLVREIGADFIVVQEGEISRKLEISTKIAEENSAERIKKGAKENEIL